MTKAASSLDPPSAGHHRASQPNAGPPRPSEFLEGRFPLNRSSAPPLAAPVLREARQKATPALLEHLQRRVREIERHASLLPAGREPGAAPWRLGAPVLDARLGLKGLEVAAVHEVKPVAEGPVAGASAAALGFLLRLAACRIRSLTRESRHAGLRILCAAPVSTLHEMGWLYGPGLAALGLDPRMFLLVETGRESDALWAIEEGLRSGSLALVIGILEGLGLTPARRLSLAAEECRTPCLLLTGARTPVAGATASRWRIAPAPSGSDPFDPAAPGRLRYSVRLERCRAAPPDAEAAYLLEWSERSFRHLPDAPSRAVRRGGVAL